MNRNICLIGSRCAMSNYSPEFPAPKKPVWLKFR